MYLICCAYVLINDVYVNSLLYNNNNKKLLQIASVTAIYAASVVDKTTVDCKVDFQLTGAFASVNT